MLTGVAHREQLFWVLTVTLSTSHLRHRELQVERRVAERLDAAVASGAFSCSLGEELRTEHASAQLLTPGISETHQVVLQGDDGPAVELVREACVASGRALHDARGKGTSDGLGWVHYEYEFG